LWCLLLLLLLLSILPSLLSRTANVLLAADYSLANPDTLTKYKNAGQIAEKVLAQVAALCVPGAKIVELCEQGDKLMEEEIEKVYRGKKVPKGMFFFRMRGHSFVVVTASLRERGLD